jgi:hypothetical protein
VTTYTCRRCLRVFDSVMVAWVHSALIACFRRFGE